MSWKQTSIDKSTIFGAGSVSRVILPYIVSGIRRNDPDMVSTSSYYPALLGKTIIIEQGGDFSGTTTITFTSSSYATAITDINAAAVTHLKAGDYDGYLAFISLHAGGNNYLKITGGTALSILGIDAYPHPASISYAGEIDSPKPSTYEARTKGTGVILKNEGVNRENWNRGLAAIGYVLDSFQANLDREIAFPIQYSTTINGSSFSITSDDRFYISGNGIVTANPSTDTLDKLISILDTSNNQLFDSSGDRVRVTSITYGTLVDATTSFSSWGTSDGKSVFGNSSHLQKVKATRTITSINGNTIKCSGATFITNKVQVNDTLKVTGATNLSPFSHNGEFYVDEVISEEVLKVRPKGSTDGVLTSLSTTPTCLNQVKGIAEVYGSVTIYMGSFLPLALPTANMVFNLSATLPNATYKVVLPIGKSLKNLLQEDITASTIVNPFGGQLELGSKLIATLANALKPRIISKPNGDTTKTLFAEFKNGTIGTRIYTLLAGGIEVVYNGKWDGTVYVKDDVTKDVVLMKEDVTSILIGTTNVSLTIDWVNKTISMGTTANQFTVTDSTGILKAKVATNFAVNDGTVDVLIVPKFDGTSASNSTAKSGLKLGTGYTTDNQHLLEKINITCNTTSNKYTLLSETVLTNARKREYVIGDGSSITTINAKWDGTQWIKDATTGNFGSAKLIVDPVTFDLKIYKHTVATSPFLDTVWTNYKIPYSLTDLGDAVFNNLKPVFHEEFTAKNEAKYQFTSTISANSSFGSTQSSADTGHFGAGKYTLDALSATWSLTSEAGYLYMGTSDFVMRYKFKIKDKSLLRTSLNPTLIGTGLGSITTLAINISSDTANIYYDWDLASTNTGIVFQNDTWYIVEWQRFAGKLYLTIDDGTTKTVVVNGTTDSVSRVFNPSFNIKCEVYAGAFPVDVFLIDYFEVYK